MINSMQMNIYPTKKQMGVAAAEKVADILSNVLKKKSVANIVLATGTSQFEFLDSLCQYEEIEWNRTIMYHLDEYIGISADHPASFRYYLLKHFVERVHLGKINFIIGDAPDPIIECKRIGNLISKIKIDIAFVGIGENGHLAFNDPPADFVTKEPFIIVDLDEKCRKQQVDEGWFTSIKEVPKKAISMSINEIMRAEYIICTCPDERKADAVRNCLSNDVKVTPTYPASILKTHKKVYCYLDKFSASSL